MDVMITKLLPQNSFLVMSLNWLPPVDCPFLNALGFPKHVIQHLKQTNKINNASRN